MIPFSSQEAVAAQQEIGTDLEQVEVLQKKFDDFKGDLKANEVSNSETLICFHAKHELQHLERSLAKLHTE